MAAFIASYAGPTGQPRTVTVKAADLAEAKKPVSYTHLTLPTMS